MPSLGVTAHTTAVEVAAERLDAIHKLKSLTVDNDAGAADIIIRVQDVFTPAVTNGVSAPVETTVDRFRSTILLGDIVTYGEEELKGIKILGALKVIADAIDAGTFITAGYETE